MAIKQSYSPTYDREAITFDVDPGYIAFIDEGRFKLYGPNDRQVYSFLPETAIEQVELFLIGYLKGLETGWAEGRLRLTAKMRQLLDTPE